MAAKKKECKWCGRVQPHSEYHKDSKAADKMQAFCKTCNKYRTMYKFYGAKLKEELEDMIKERKVRILLMEMNLNKIKAREAVSIATQSLFQK